MKKLLLVFVFSFIMFGGIAQTAGSKDCYTEWYDMFQKYGAQPVTDGTHDVIVSLCANFRCECYLGKINVSEGRLVPGSLMIQQEDGSFERPKRSLHPKYQLNPESGIPTDIQDGMSPAYLTDQDEIVHVLFYKSLSKIPRKQKTAPTPTQLGIK